MITKAILLFSTFTLGGTIPTLCIKNDQNNVLVRKIESLNDVNEAKFDLNSKGIIFIKDIDLNHKNELASIAENNLCEIDVNAEIYGKYYFNAGDGTIGEGYLIGTNFTTSKDLNNMVDKVKDEIETGKLCNEYLSTCSNDIVSMTIGDS